MSTSDPFAFLDAHQFLLLTTYRKDRTAVPTTVWFANDGGKLYITTQKTAGKIKRIRNNARVQMVPSDRMGTIVEEITAKGNARELLSASERIHARAALKQKYGDQFEQIAGPETDASTYIVVEPAS